MKRLLSIFLFLYVTLFPFSIVWCEIPYSSQELLELARENSLYDPENAKQLASKALESAQRENLPEIEVKSYYQLGEIHIRQGDREEALTKFEKGLELAEKIEDKMLIAQGNYNLSFYYEVERDYERAIGLLDTALELFKQLDKKRNMAFSYTSYGRIYQKISNYDKALEMNFQSLQINEELGNTSGISVVKTNIGMLYQLTSNYADAMDYFTSARAIDSLNNDLEGIFINTLNIGVIHQRTGNYEEALVSYQHALDLVRQLKYEEDEALLLGNMGTTLRQMGRYEEALEKLFSSLTLLGNKYDNSSNLNAIAQTYLELQQPNDARIYALDAIAAAKTFHNLKHLHQGYLNLSTALEKLADFDASLKALQNANIIRDSITLLEGRRQMEELKISYETDQKEQTIELLTLKNRASELQRRNFLIFGLLIVIILLLLVYSQMTISRKNREMFEKEHGIAKMKSRFLANISHEFRTPLTLILGPIQLLRQNSKDAKMDLHLHAMEKSANRLLELINQLLDLSKVEAGNLTLDLKGGDIVTTVKGVTMNFQSMAETKKTDLQVKSAFDSLEMQFDKEKLETIIINLLTNSFRYTPEGGSIKVHMDVVGKTKNAKKCRISVVDNGEGISEQDIKYVFERFYHDNDNKTGLYEGSGIGLALTKELVELHKGTIEIFSAEGKGTEVVIHLPIKDVKDQSSISTEQVDDKLIVTPIIVDQTDHVELTTTHPVKEIEQPTLLVVEDSKDVMRYIKDILDDTYRILEAYDGERGTELAYEHIPDVVISDVMMPKKNGYQVCDSLKSDERTSHIPIILLTAKVSLDDKLEGLQAKADVYLTKPFAPKELLQQIKNLIDIRGALKERYRRYLVLKPTEVIVNSIDEKFLKKLMKVVEDNIADENFNMDKLGQEVGMSRSQIHRKLHALTNQSTTEFVRSYRLNRAMDMIRQKAGSISEIAFLVGFQDPSYFSKSFQQQFGQLPSQVKKSDETV